MPRFFFLLLAASTVLMALVVRPLGVPLFLAMVLAVALWPGYRRLSANLGNRPRLASGGIVFGIVLVLVVPLVAFSTFIVKEGQEGLQVVSTLVRSEGVTGMVKRLPEPLEKIATDLLARVPEPSEDGGGAEKVVEQAGAGGGKVAGAAAAAASGTGALFFQAAMLLIALYSMLVNGGALVTWLEGNIPLQRGQTRELLTEVKTVSRAVLLSTIVTAAVQSLAALIGFLIGGVPYPLVFASATFFVAVIPLGAAAVSVVAALILLTTGHPYMGLFLVFWGFVVVGMVDNLVKPLILEKGMKMNPAIAFFALIGGLSAFGVVGVLLGPLVVAFFLALLRMYQRDHRKAAHA